LLGSPIESQFASASTGGRLPRARFSHASARAGTRERVRERACVRERQSEGERERFFARRWRGCFCAWSRVGRWRKRRGERRDRAWARRSSPLALSRRLARARARFYAQPCSRSLGLGEVKGAASFLFLRRAGDACSCSSRPQYVS